MNNSKKPSLKSSLGSLQINHSVSAPITIVKKNECKDAPPVSPFCPSYTFTLSSSSKDTASWRFSADEFSKLIGSPPSKPRIINRI